ncbi:MAG: class IV adenylate cyclase [Eubacterium sp.]|nr:class IV adenylate cyclase [Eubacterium sp.]
MKKEVEVKYKISADKYEHIKNILEKMDKEFNYLEQKDSYYCQTDFFPNIKSIPYLLRIREENNKNTWMAYKALVEDRSSWVELETGVESPFIIDEIFQKIGHCKFMEIKKRRLSFHVGSFEINLDDVDKLGLFIEGEFFHEDISYGKKKIIDFMENNLGLSPKNRINDGYVNLMKKYYGYI